jgi:hypothetical protein
VDSDCLEYNDGDARCASNSHSDKVIAGVASQALALRPILNFAALIQGFNFFFLHQKFKGKLTLQQP